MFASYKYHCPKCDSELNHNKRVQLNIMKNERLFTVISLNPKPGEYDYECDPQVDFEKGELLDFHCPACKENLQSDRFKDFISIVLRPADKINFEVLFDRGAGQHTTYVMTEDMIEKHGEHPKDLI